MDSFKIICTTLAQAEPDWWRYSDEYTSPLDTEEVAKSVENGCRNEIVADDEDDDEEEIDLDAVE